MGSNSCTNYRRTCYNTFFMEINKEKPSHRQQAFHKIPAILFLMGSKSVKFNKVRSEILKQNNEKYISELKRA